MGESLLAQIQLCLELADFDAAEIAIGELEAIVLRDFGQAHPNDAVVLQCKARLAREKGQLAEARNFYAQALDILVAAEAPAEAIAACRNNLAFASQQLGDYVAAEAMYQAAIDALRQSTAPAVERMRSQTLSNLACLYHDIGQDSRAEKVQREALAIDEKTLHGKHPDYADHIHNLGMYLAQQGQLAQAAELIGRSTEITEQTYGRQHPRYAAVLAEQAAFHAEFRQFKEAEVKAVFALETVRRIQGERHPSFPGMLRLLGSVYSACGKFDQAEGALEHAAKLESELLPQDHPDAAQTQKFLVIAQAARGKTQQALATLARFQHSQAVMAECVLRLCSDAERLKYVGSLQSDFEMSIAFVTQFCAGDAAAIRWAYDLTLCRKGLAAEAFAARRDSILGQDDVELRVQLERLNQLRTLIGRVLLDRSFNTQAADTKRQLAAHETEKAELEHRLSRRIPEIGLSLRLRDANTEAIAAALPAGTMLIEFVRFASFRFNAVEAEEERRWGKPRYAAFSMQAGRPDSLRLMDLGPAAGIDRNVVELRQWITGDDASRGSTGADERFGFADVLSGLSSLLRGRRRAQALQRGAALRSALLHDALPDEFEATRLIIAPDGTLASLPFESLPHGDGVLLDRFTVSYLNSGREVLRFGVGSSASSSKPVVIADPDFDLHGSGPAIPEYSAQSRDLRGAVPHFVRLKGTRDEGCAVAKQLEVTPKLDADALESTVKQCRSPLVLHLATHGFFFESSGIKSPEDGVGRIRFAENPMLRSGLALAGANAFLDGKPLPKEAEDGILTAEDVSGLDLRATDLVVLSACETGLGEVRNGEGVFGLRRAFALAGARTLMVSLWKVADAQTAELMTHFYRELDSCKQPAAALKKAKMALRAKCKDAYYWAAFICVGDPGVNKEEYPCKFQASSSVRKALSH